MTNPLEDKGSITAQAADATEMVEEGAMIATNRRSKMSGFGILISVGRWGGVWIAWRGTFAKRLSLGWLAITFLPFDGDDLLHAAVEYGEGNLKRGVMRRHGGR